jgi:hypothetical protein
MEFFLVVGGLLFVGICGGSVYMRQQAWTFVFVFGCRS